VVNLKVKDYFQTGKRSVLRFKEKAARERRLPVHHKLEEILDEYLKVAARFSKDFVAHVWYLLVARSV
jgi:integrase/recombinase XerD